MAFVPFTKDEQPTMQAFNEKFEQAIGQAIAAGVKIEVGSYVGTGTYGESNKLNVTCDFAIKILIITSFASGNTPVIWQTGEPGANYKPANGYTNNKVNFSQSNTGKTVYWYGDSQHTQLNISDITYHYFAIG